MEEPEKEREDRDRDRARDRGREEEEGRGRRGRERNYVGSKYHLMDCPDAGLLPPQCYEPPRPLPHPSRH